jgi:hypothetical protein
LGLEATIESLRQRMESLRGEMEACSNKPLNTDEKVHALNSDVAQWNKAKNRVRYAVPKVKEFIHRAIWALGTPERKKLDELFKNQTRPDMLSPQLDKMLDELDYLLKDRQVLSAQGVTIYQEGKSSCDDVQKNLRTLQSNAHKKRVAARAKGKSF